MRPADAALLLGASFLAGVMNALAGGGTILTYPALRLAGLDAIAANATSTVALLPGALASLAGYRREVATHRDWFRVLFLPSLLGGTIGSILLLATPERTFARLAPALVLFATVLFSVQGFVRRRLDRKRPSDGNAGATAPDDAAPGRRAGAWVAQLGVAIYGGYFGAGIGILMLAVLGFLGLRDIHAMNGLKNFFGFSINLVAAIYFAARGAVVWPVAALMVIGAVVGGYGGARLARRVGPKWSRRAVVVIGLAVTALLAFQELG